jgi:hypothetical protein
MTSEAWPNRSEIPDGWKLVTHGKTRGGDKYWWASQRAWIPVGYSDDTQGADVREKDMPYVIRKGGSE